MWSSWAEVEGVPGGYRVLPAAELAVVAWIVVNCDTDPVSMVSNTNELVVAPPPLVRSAGGTGACPAKVESSPAPLLAWRLLAPALCVAREFEETPESNPLPSYRDDSIGWIEPDGAAGAGAVAVPESVSLDFCSTAELCLRSLSSYSAQCGSIVLSLPLG